MSNGPLRCLVCQRPALGECRQYTRPGGWLWRLLGRVTGRRYVFASLPIHPECIPFAPENPPTPRRLSWRAA
jgi:hypothetical protein